MKKSTRLAIAAAVALVAASPIARAAVVCQGPILSNGLGARLVIETLKPFRVQFTPQDEDGNWIPAYYPYGSFDGTSFQFKTSHGSTFTAVVQTGHLLVSFAGYTGNRAENVSLPCNGDPQKLASAR